MRVFFIQLILPLATYVIGVFIGRWSILKQLIKKEQKDFDEELISHVGYTYEQMGLDK